MKYCCEFMKYYLELNCDGTQKNIKSSDQIVIYEQKFDEYGIVIHDGGDSYIEIKYCPWCGKELPKSKRDLWFEKLEEMGIDSPCEEKIPKEFKTDLWRKKDKTIS